MPSSARAGELKLERAQHRQRSANQAAPLVDIRVSERRLVPWKRGRYRGPSGPSDRGNPNCGDGSAHATCLLGRRWRFEPMNRSRSFIFSSESRNACWGPPAARRTTARPREFPLSAPVGRRTQPVSETPPPARNPETGPTPLPGVTAPRAAARTYEGPPGNTPIAGNAPNSSGCRVAAAQVRTAMPRA
jgi:hypothetical protein